MLLNDTQCPVDLCAVALSIGGGLLEGGILGVLRVAIDLQCLLLVVPSTTSLQDLHNGGVGEYCLVFGLNQCVHLSWLRLLPFFLSM